jgi:hypothetical protein
LISEMKRVVIDRVGTLSQRLATVLGCKFESLQFVWLGRPNKKSDRECTHGNAAVLFAVCGTCIAYSTFLACTAYNKHRHTVSQ